MGGLWEVFGRSLGLWEVLGGLWEVFGRSSGGFLEVFGRPLGALGRLGVPWGRLGSPRVLPEGHRGNLGPRSGGAFC